MRRRSDDEQRHLQELSKAQAVAASRSAAQTPPSFDLVAIKRLLDDLKTQSVSREDISALIEDAVGRNLKGVARSSDLADSAKHLERALSKLPLVSSEQAVQAVVTEELSDAVKKFAKHMPNEQRKLEAPPAQPHRVQAESQREAQESSSASSRSKALARREVTGTTPNYSKSRSADIVKRTDNAAPDHSSRSGARPGISNAVPIPGAVPRDAVARVKAEEPKPVRKAPASVQSSDRNAVTRAKYSEGLASRSGVPLCAAENSLAGVQTDRERDGSKGAKPPASVSASTNNALARTVHAATVPTASPPQLADTLARVHPDTHVPSRSSNSEKSSAPVGVLASNDRLARPGTKDISKPARLAASTELSEAAPRVVSEGALA